MIEIVLGNIGSGKTACMVREMHINPSNRLTYSNILTKGLKNVKVISPDMIVKKEFVKLTKKRDGSEEPVYELKLNIDFWKSINEPINVIIDEAHSIFNARRSMSKVNVIMSDWMALLRRVLGQASDGYGKLTLITQLPNRIDCIARDMATKVKFHRCHFLKTCRRCKRSWPESNDTPEQLWTCPSCGHIYIDKHSHKIEVWHFKNMEMFNAWNDFGSKTYHKHYYINDIEKYFKYYNTLQWDNLLSELYQ